MTIEMNDYEHIYIQYKNVELVVQALPPVDTELRKEQYPRLLVLGTHSTTGRIEVSPPRWLEEDEEGVVFKRT